MTEPHYKDLKTIFDEALSSRNLDCEKLAKLTGIPKHFILALQNLEIKKLPAAPYVKGYLKKIAAILELDDKELWQLYEKELTHKTSGAFDKLPANRFAVRGINKKNAILIIIGVLLLIYFIFNYKNLFGKPSLEITGPAESAISVENSTYTLTGKISPRDKFTINGAEIFTDQNGNFQFLYNLQPGINSIEFKVKKLLGAEKKEFRQIIFQPSGE